VYGELGLKYAGARENALTAHGRTKDLASKMGIDPDRIKITVRARPGRLSASGVSHSQSIFYGAFV
jgi:hypothetical protein